MEEKKTYCVANYQWVLAGHDLTLEEAQNVLERELNNDPNNEEEREIIDQSNEEE
jgi:hypothetical protein